MATWRRDPVSELFDAGARRLLERAYASPGVWVKTVLADPTPAQVARFASLGIVVPGTDRPSAQGGTGLNTRTRWARGFVRAVYYQHRWWSGARGSGWRDQRRAVARHTGGLRAEVGRHQPAVGRVPAGRAVRVKLERGGQAKLAAVRRKPDSQRIYTDAGDAGARWSDPDLRDW